MQRLAQIFFLCLCTSLTYASLKTTHAFRFDDSVINLTKAQSTFSLRLKTNPSTGYEWVLSQFDPKFFTPISHTIEPPVSNLIGASTREVFTFKAKSEAFTVPQISLITFIYMRPWQKVEKGTHMTFQIITR